MRNEDATVSRRRFLETAAAAGGAAWIGAASASPASDAKPGMKYRRFGRHRAADFRDRAGLRQRAPLAATWACPV